LPSQTGLLPKTAKWLCKIGSSSFSWTSASKRPACYNKKYL
jgi:hypothetical protein